MGRASGRGSAIAAPGNSNCGEYSGHVPVNIHSDFMRASMVPEPGSWALLIAGFGLAGGALRRRRTLVA